MNAKEWRLQFETLVQEAELYLAAHSFDPEHLKICNPQNLVNWDRRNPQPDWTCFRMKETIVLCRQVLARHKH